MHAQPVKENGQLKVANAQLTNAQGKALVLRGMSLAGIISGHGFIMKVQWPGSPKIGHVLLFGQRWELSLAAVTSKMKMIRKQKLKQ